MADSNIDKFRTAGERASGSVDKPLAERFGSRVGGALQGASDFATSPVRAMAGAAETGRSAVADFGRGVMNPQQPFSDIQSAQAGTPEHQRSSGFIPGAGAPATAFRGGRGHTGRESAGDVSQFLDDNRPTERSVHDPLSGNPIRASQAFGEDIYSRGNSSTNVTNKQGEPMFADGSEFMKEAEQQAMSDSPARYTGGAEDFGAPGSSGMGGPGGTVNTISSEAFTSPGGQAAGDAAVGQARRDFQLRQEGNAHLASDATPEEIRAGKIQKLKQDLQNVDLSGGQSFTSLTANRNKARRLQGEINAVQEGASTASALDFKAQQNALDRQADLQESLIENQPGSGGNLKVGGTMEATRRQLVEGGWHSLNPEQQFLMTHRVREQALSDLEKEREDPLHPKHGEPVTQQDITERTRLILGDIMQEAERGERRRAPDGNEYVYDPHEGGDWKRVDE